MGTTDKKYKFLIEYENFEMKRAFIDFTNVLKSHLRAFIKEFVSAPWCSMKDVYDDARTSKKYCQFAKSAKLNLILRGAECI